MMDIAALYAHLETTEEGKALIAPHKDHMSKLNGAEADLRHLKTSLDGLDITAARATLEFVNKSGGVDGLKNILSEADGVKTAKASLEATLQEHQGKSKQLEDQLKQEKLKNIGLAEFSKVFKSPETILDLAMQVRGQLVYDESGNPVVKTKDGSVHKWGSKEGIEYLKAEYSDFLVTPAGAGSNPKGNPKPNGARTISFSDYAKLTGREQAQLTKENVEIV